MSEFDVSIQVGSKYGCLTVLDTGEEYVTSDIYREYKKESDALGRGFSKNSTYMRLMKRVTLFPKLRTHYKCQCECGRICYYNAKTIASKPRFCLYPIPISTRRTYDRKVADSIHRKRETYRDLECVILCDKADCKPKSEYCELYNAYKLKKLQKREERKEREAALWDLYPHVLSESYDVTPLMVHDTLEYVQRLDDKEVLNMKSGCYVKYAMHEYRCHLCGRTFRFSDTNLQTTLRVHPPTEYGCHAHNGYWSNGHCNCHPISSFQWTVLDILEKYHVRYRTEIGFDGLVGDLELPLRFDVCVWLNDTTYCLIECQGEQHYEPVAEFGGKNTFNRQFIYDNRKREFCNKHGIQLIEIPRQKHNQYAYVEKMLRDMRIIS